MPVHANIEVPSRRKRSPVPEQITDPLNPGEEALLNSSGSNRANTHPDMSCEGFPLGSTKNICRHSLLALPKDSISVQPSAPRITAHMAIITISTGLCLLVRSPWSRHILKAFFYFSSCVFPHSVCFVLVCPGHSTPFPQILNFGVLALGASVQAGGRTTGFWYNGSASESVPGHECPGLMEEICEFETKKRFVCYIPDHTGRDAGYGVQLLLTAW